MRHGIFDTAARWMQAQTNTPKWLGISAAAKYAGVSTRLIENWISSKLIRSANVIVPGATRGRRLIDRESLDAWIESHIDALPAVIKMNQKRQPEGAAR